MLFMAGFAQVHLPEGVIFGSLKEVAGKHPDLVKKYYGKLADTAEDGVTAFNTAFAQDGVLFYVPKNVVVEKPIQLVNILRGDVNFMVNLPCADYSGGWVHKPACWCVIMRWTA